MSFFSLLYGGLNLELVCVGFATNCLWKYLREMVCMAMSYLLLSKSWVFISSRFDLCTYLAQKHDIKKQIIIDFQVKYFQYKSHHDIFYMYWGPGWIDRPHWDHGKNHLNPKTHLNSHIRPKIIDLNPFISNRNGFGGFYHDSNVRAPWPVLGIGHPP